LQEAIGQVHHFLESKGILSTEFVFLSCGDFDGRTMKRESKHKQFEVPNYLKRWINIKKVFQSALDFSDANTIYKIHTVVSGMPEMLQKSGLELIGKHHSGIDDARNIARCVIKTLE